MTTETTKTKEKGAIKEEGKPTCGIIMPISAIDGCNSEHWNNVKKILSEAIESAGYFASLVSAADDIGIIQKRIVQNLYDNEIVVCDVSGKNPNVMFELGMRLAFDKPTIIVMDDNTNYPFDTAPIEHLLYPRNLEYYPILDFKEKLKSKILATIKKSKEDSNYTTFLKHFGEFKVAHIEKTEGSLNDVVLSRLDEINGRLANLPRDIRVLSQPVLKSAITPQRIMPIAIELIRAEIELFCRENNIKDKLDLKGERNNLLSYLEKIPEIRMACGSPQTLMRFTDDIIEDFLFFKENRRNLSMQH